MEERLGEMRKGRREDEKGSHCFFKSCMTSWSSSIKIWFFKLIECIIKMSWCETNAKICAIVEQNVIN